MNKKILIITGIVLLLMIGLAVAKSVGQFIPSKKVIEFDDVGKKLNILSESIPSEGVEASDLILDIIDVQNDKLYQEQSKKESFKGYKYIVNTGGVKNAK